MQNSFNFQPVHVSDLPASVPALEEFVKTKGSVSLSLKLPLNHHLNYVANKNEEKKELSEVVYFEPQQRVARADAEAEARLEREGAREARAVRRD